MTTGTVPEGGRAYLGAVRARLDDPPAEEREDLRADVEPSVLDSAEESDVPVELRLGPPDRFADELRAAAGLPPRARAVPPAAPPGPTLYDAGFGTRYAGIPVFGAGAFAVAAASIGSVAIGLRRPRRNALLVFVNLLLILATPPVLANALDSGRAAVFNDGVVSSASTPVAPQGVVFSNGAEVQNIYAFDRGGRLLVFDAPQTGVRGMLGGSHAVA